MPYKTRPRIPGTPFPNLFKHFEVSAGKIITHDKFEKEPPQQEWGADQKPTVKTLKGQWFKNWIGCGSVSVKTVGEPEIYGPFLFTAGAFMQAVKGLHPDVKEPVAKPKEPLWSEKLTDKDLADFMYLIPALPGVIESLLWERYSKLMMPEYGKINQWYDRKETMAVYMQSIVKAPNRGQLKANRFCLDLGEDKKLDGIYPQGMPQVLVLFQPHKDNAYDIRWRDAYDMDVLYKQLKPYIHDNKRLPGRYDGNEKFRAALIAQYEQLGSMTLKTMKVSDMPKLHPDLERERFADNSSKPDLSM